MSRFRLTIQGKQLQKRSVEKLVRSLKDLKKKGEIEITVEEDNPPTSRAAPEEGGRMTACCKAHIKKYEAIDASYPREGAALCCSECQSRLVYHDGVWRLA